MALTIKSPYIHFLFTLSSNATLDNHFESIERFLSIKQDSGVTDIFIISLQILSKTLAIALSINKANSITNPLKNLNFPSMFSYWIFIICVTWMCIWSTDYGQQVKVSNHNNSGIIFWEPHISISGCNVTRTGDWQTEKCEENFPKFKMKLIFLMFSLLPYMMWLLRYQKKIKIGNCGMTCIMRHLLTLALELSWRNPGI